MPTSRIYTEARDKTGFPLTSQVGVTAPARVWLRFKRDNPHSIHRALNTLLKRYCVSVLTGAELLEPMPRVAHGAAVRKTVYVDAQTYRAMQVVGQRHGLSMCAIAKQVLHAYDLGTPIS